MKTKFITLLSVIIIFFLSAVNASATTYWVAKEGDDDHDWGHIIH